MVRRDFFELRRATRSATASASSSRPTARSSTPAKARRLAAMDYLDIQISLDGVDAATNDAVRGDGSYAMARRAMDHLADADFGPFKISVVVTRHNVDQLDEFKALADSLRRPAARHPPAPVAAAAPTRGTTCTRRNAQQREIYRLAARPRRGRAHRRLVLPPQRARRAAARAEHVRRRPGGVPDRPGRRRVRLPVRDPRRVPGRLGARRRRVRRGVEAQRRCSPSCASRSRRARARAAAATTPARAGAWRPSSSPGCRSTAPIPSASTATASSALAGWPSGRPARGRRADHTKPVTFLRR